MRCQQQYCKYVSLYFHYLYFCVLCKSYYVHYSCGRNFKKSIEFCTYKVSNIVTSLMISANKNMFQEHCANVHIFPLIYIKMFSFHIQNFHVFLCLKNHTTLNKHLNNVTNITFVYNFQRTLPERSENIPFQPGSQIIFNLDDILLKQ